jgi:uncharacterized membrane protein YcjF (UPF0283 family)
VSAWERAVRWARRNPSAAGLIAVSVLAILALLGVAVTYNARLARERDEAREQRGKAERALALAVKTGAVVDELGMQFYRRNVQDKTEETFLMAANAMTQNLKLLEDMVKSAGQPGRPRARPSRCNIAATCTQLAARWTTRRRTCDEPWSSGNRSSPHTPSGRSSRRARR